MSHTEKIEKCSEDFPLSALIFVQQQCCDIQVKFADEVGTFVRVLKEWENFCELIMKTKSELQKTHTNKEKEKLRVGDSFKPFEFSYLAQRDELYRMLTRYFSAEMENQKKAKEFQTKLSTFLTSCRDQVEQNCANEQPTSSPTVSSRVFNASLRSHLDAEGYSTVLRSTLAYLTKSKAYAQEGIFRVPGQVSSINLLKDAFDHGMADEELLECCGVFEVADLMKQYLRDLPEPILPADLLNNWPADTPKVEAAKSLINTHVEETNRRNLFLLLKFLSEVVENQNSSKMSVENLTVTLWKSFYNNSTSCNVPRIVQYLISHARELLEGEKESGNLRQERKEGPKSRPPPPPRPNPPFQTHSYSPQLSGSEAANPPVERLSSVPRPSNSPNLVTNFSTLDGRPKSETTHPVSDQTYENIPAFTGQWKPPKTIGQISDTTDTKEKSKKEKKKKEESESEGSEESDDETSEDSSSSTSTPSSVEKEEEEKEEEKEQKEKKQKKEKEKKKHKERKSPKTREENSKTTKAEKKTEKLKFDEEGEDKMSTTSKGHNAPNSKKKSSSGSDDGMKKASAPSEPPRPASCAEK
ncbi:hypothetical protein Aperf_G00000087894 [Anoplocephala perfoliata]